MTRYRRRGEEKPDRDAAGEAFFSRSAWSSTAEQGGQRDEQREWEAVVYLRPYIKNIL